MRVTCRLSVMVLLLAVPALFPAPDLKKIVLRVGKEPAYRTGKPAYCLAVFGPLAATRLWLVHDGEDLYVDRDGDGDLTGPGEKVAARVKKVSIETSFGPVDGEELSFEIGDVTEQGGRFKHRGFRLEVDSSRTYRLTVLTAGKWEQYSYRFKFAAAAKEAPVIHFHGPRRLQLVGRPQLTPSADGELAVEVSTPGLGPNSTAVYYNLSIPRDVHPRAEVTFPARSGGKPMTVRATLDKRC